MGQINKNDESRNIFFRLLRDHELPAPNCFKTTREANANSSPAAAVPIAP